MSMEPSGVTFRGANDGTFCRHPWEFGHTCTLNSIHKHIKLTLTGHSTLCSKL